MLKLGGMKRINYFLALVNDCEGGVWLESQYGDRYNLKSQLSQFIAYSALLNEHGDELELVCQLPQDEERFRKFLEEV